MTQFSDKAASAWGTPLPDWIAALAGACDTHGQNATAKRIGYSAAVVSGVLGHTYKGDFTAVEDRVRVRLMRETVECPARFEISREECQLWQERAANFSSHNAERVKMARACRRCTHFTGGQDGSL